MNSLKIFSGFRKYLDAYIPNTVQGRTQGDGLEGWSRPYQIYWDNSTKTEGVWLHLHWSLVHNGGSASHNDREDFCAFFYLLPIFKMLNHTDYFPPTAVYEFDLPVQRHNGNWNDDSMLVGIRELVKPPNEHGGVGRLIGLIRLNKCPLISGNIRESLIKLTGKVGTATQHWEADLSLLKRLDADAAFRVQSPGEIIQRTSETLYNFAHENSIPLAKDGDGFKMNIIQVPRERVFTVGGLRIRIGFDYMGEAFFIEVPPDYSGEINELFFTPFEFMESVIKCAHTAIPSALDYRTIELRVKEK